MRQQKHTGYTLNGQDESPQQGFPPDTARLEWLMSRMQLLKSYFNVLHITFYKEASSEHIMAA